MNIPSSITQKFFVKNCSLAAIAVGEYASSLLELRDKIATVDESCIYYHFWGGKMNSQFTHSQYHNDFANWAYHRLHDHILAEKLSIIDPTEFENLEDLRQEVLETIEKRMDDHEVVLLVKKDDRFNFIRSTIIIYENSTIVHSPEDLASVISKLPPNSIYYHFIDARGRTSNKVDDFSEWLSMFGNQYEQLIKEIQAIDPYFLSLSQIKDELTRVIQDYFKK
jgi:hypothetical protein